MLYIVLSVTITIGVLTYLTGILDALGEMSSSRNPFVRESTVRKTRGRKTKDNRSVLYELEIAAGADNYQSSPRSYLANPVLRVTLNAKLFIFSRPILWRWVVFGRGLVKC